MFFFQQHKNIAIIRDISVYVSHHEPPQTFMKHLVNICKKGKNMLLFFDMLELRNWDWDREDTYLFASTSLKTVSMLESPDTLHWIETEHHSLRQLAQPIISVYICRLTRAIEWPEEETFDHLSGFCK